MCAEVVQMAVIARDVRVAARKAAKANIAHRGLIKVKAISAEDVKRRWQARGATTINKYFFSLRNFEDSTPLVLLSNSKDGSHDTSNLRALSYFRHEVSLDMVLSGSHPLYLTTTNNVVGNKKS